MHIVGVGELVSGAVLTTYKHGKVVHRLSSMTD